MQKIIVENFGPIEHAEIELRDFVVLIGEQASGKSTLAKLVYFFKVLSQDFALSEPLWDTYDLHDILNQLSKATNQKFTKYFGPPSPPSEPLHNFKIQFYFDLENDKWVTLELATTKHKEGLSMYIYQTSYSQAFCDDLNRRFNLILNKIRSAYGTSIFIEHSDTDEEIRKKSIKQLPIIKEAWDVVYNNFHSNTVFFPASRHITVNFSGLFADTFSETIAKRLDTIVNKSDWVLIKSFLDHIKVINEDFKTHKDFESMSRNYESLGKTFNAEAVWVFLKSCRSILKGKYESNGSGEKIRLDGKGDKSISLENTSTGQQESIRILQDIYLILLNNLSDYRIIEEPESHLFPSAQKYLIELLSLVANTTSSQIFITTHSPYVLSVLANLLYASKVNKLNAASVSEIEDKTGISHLTWLDKEKFAAYTMDGGKAVSIFDRGGTGMIDQNYLDQISEDLGRDFNFLYRMRAKQVKNEG